MPKKGGILYAIPHMDGANFRVADSEKMADYYNLVLKGSIYQLRGDTELAKEHLEMARQIAPMHPTAIESLLYVLLAEKAMKDHQNKGKESGLNNFLETDYTIPISKKQPMHGYYSIPDISGHYSLAKPTNP